MVRHEVDVTRHQLLRNGVELMHAEASFVDAHTIRLTSLERAERIVAVDKVVIAVGTEAAVDPRMPLDGDCVFSSDDILQMKELPTSSAVTAPA